MTIEEILAGLRRLAVEGTGGPGTPQMQTGAGNILGVPVFDPTTIGGEREVQRRQSMANIPSGLAEAEQQIPPGPAPPPLVEPQVADQPDLEQVPPADLSQPLRDLGITVQGTRRLTGAAGEPFYTNRTDRELAEAGGLGGRGGFVKGTGGPAPAPPPRPETPGEAALGSARARVRALDNLRTQLINANPADPRLANVEAQLAQAMQGYQGALGLPTAEAQAERAAEEARTAPLTREKVAGEQAIKREEIAGREAVARGQGVGAAEIARGLGLDQERIKALGALDLERLKAGAVAAQKEFDRETKRGELSGAFLKELASSFNTIQYEKDPTKRAERAGYLLQFAKSMQDLLIGGRGGQPSTPGSPGVAPTQAPPEIRQRAEQAARRAGKALRPGQQFKDVATGQVYVF